MSTAAVSTAPLPSANQAESDRFIEERISEARNALWWAEFVRESLTTLIAALMAVIVWVIVDQWVYSPNVGARLVAFAGLAGWCVWRFLTRIWPLLGSSIQPAYAARSLERDLPEMKQALTSYVTLRTEQQQPGLRSRVVRSIGSAVAGRLKTHDTLPGEATGTLKWWLAAIAALTILILYAAFSPKSTIASVSRLVAPLASIEPPKRVSIREVKPGDTDAIAGRSVNVSALVDGLKPDERVWCRWHTAADLQETELSFNESELRYAGAINLDHAAMGKVAYYIEAGDAKAGPFWLSVENVPVVALESVRYEPPAYTGEDPHTSSSGAITAVDGTKVTISAVTNRAIEKASIEFNPRALGETVRATAGTKPLQIDQAGTGLSVTFPLRSSRGRSAAVQFESYRIVVTDAAGQANPDPIVYPIRVIADLPPEVSIVMPRKTPKNLPIDGQQVIEVHAMDPDFGLKQISLEVRRGIDVVAEPSLWSDPDGVKGNRVSEYRFRPSEHGLRAGDVVKIAALASDNRYMPGDSSIEPNIVRTDAIELRIVDSQPLPQQADGNDGLSAPDDRPASDDKGDQQSQSESASDSTGQSDQQDGGGGGEGSAAQQDGSSGQDTESGQNGESGQKTKPGEDAGKSGENNQPQNGSGAGEQQSGEKSDSSQGGKPNQADPGEQTDPNGADSQKQSPADGAGQDNNQTTGSDPSQSGQPGGEGAQDPNAKTSDTPAEGSPAEGGEPSEGSQQPNGQPGSEQTPGEASDAPPKHDGEAFERIRDYLEKKQEEQSKDSGAEGQQPTDQQTESSKTQPENGQPRDGQPRDTERAENQSGDREGSGSKDGPATQEPDPGEQSGDRGTENGQPPKQQPADGQPAESKESDAQKDSAGQTTEPKQTPSGQPSPTEKQPTGTEPSPSQQQPGDGSESSETGSKDSPQDQSPSGDKPSPGQQQPSDDKGEGAPQAGEKGQGGKQAGDKEATSKEAGADKEAGDKGKGDPSKPDPGSEADSQQGGDSSKRGSDEPGDSKDSQTKASEKSPQDSPRDGSQSKPSDSGPSQQTGDPTSTSTPPQGTPTQASGDGSGTDEGAQAAPPAASKPDLEYTKKATDMVLDYLKETRDKPDSDLLEELNWSEEDLKRFADRWQKVRELDKPGMPDAETSKDVEEALRSLGMRPQAADAALQNQDQADTLRGLRDSGNRKPPPAAYRDVFEAFRLAVGRQ